MNNSKGVETSSSNLVCRKQANQPNVTRNTADHNDNAAAAQRHDEESASSSVSSVQSVVQSSSHSLVQAPWYLQGDQARGREPRDANLGRWEYFVGETAGGCGNHRTANFSSPRNPYESKRTGVRGPYLLSSVEGLAEAWRKG